MHSLETMSATGAGKCNRIRHIVRLRQILRRWRSKAASSCRSTAGNFSGRIPSDVPAGHVAVCVGSSCRRFVVRATYLNHPVFKKLLVQAEEEYGFSNHGPLVIPCDESLFEDILRFLSRTNGNSSSRFTNLEDLQRCRPVGARNLENRPLLHGFSQKTIW